VQPGPEPIVHLVDRSRTICPLREELQMRRTKSPVKASDGLDAAEGQGASVLETIVMAPWDGEAKSSRRFSLRPLAGQKAEGGRGPLNTDWRKRLYICAGFDDYRIATPGQASLRPMRPGVGVNFA
jgi:hypothetical protein